MLQLWELSQWVSNKAVGAFFVLFSVYMVSHLVV